MFQRLKKIISIVVILHMAIFVISYIFHHKMTLLYYIDISFYFSSTLLVTALLLYIIRSGFFDVIFKSFTIAFWRGHDTKKFHEVKPLSKLVLFDQIPLFRYGLLIGFFMLIALFFYYV